MDTQKEIKENLLNDETIADKLVYLTKELFNIDEEIYSKYSKENVN